MSSFSQQKNSNLPPRMRHKFKMRNPKRQFHTQPEDDMQMMANNLLKLQRQITEQFQSSQEQIKFDEKEQNSEQISDEKDQELNKNEPQCSLFPTNRNQHQILNEIQQYSLKKQEFQTKQVSIKEKLQKKYEQYLSWNKFSSNYEQKINQLLDSENEIMSIGNAIALFQMVYYFKEILTKEVLNEIQSKTFRSIISLQQNKANDSENKLCFNKDSNDQLIKIAYAQLIAICGTTSQQIVGYYLHEIIQNPSSFQQSFNVLINMGVYGLVTLIKIVNEGFQQLSQKVLIKLCKSDLIISKIIVPQIYYDLVSVSSSTKDKNTALFLLSKIGSIAHSQELMEILFSLFKSHSIDKNLLISAIMSTGKQQSEKIIINLLKQPNISEDIAVFIIKSLSISSNNHRKMKLKVQICEYSVVDLLQINKLYFYQGPIKSYFCEYDKYNDKLFVNSRMLMSLAEKYVIDKENQYIQNSSLTNETQFLKEFILSQIIAKQQKQQQQEVPNLEVIDLFLTLLQRSKQKIPIKSALIQALGNIILPQNPIEVIEKLINYLFSSDPSLLSTTCLTLSKFQFIPSAKVVQRLRQLLKHNLWKVRISACQAIGSILRQPVDNVLDTLIRCLKDGSINRELVCQTLLKIHPVCEELLIEILKSSKDTKIQEIVLCSFNEKQTLLSDNFLKILETIFKFSKNQKRQIRYICLGVVSNLRRLSTQEQIELNHFKDKNILPFYYNFLSDSCTEIRDLALNLILDFGSYADLILIEGMTKGQLKCKIQCAKGLGLRGVQNFRALLLGMRDMNKKVRQKSCISILQNFEVQQIIQEYQYQQSQCISLVYNIKDLIQTGENMGQQIKMFLSQLMYRLSGNITHFKFDQIDEDREIEKQINEFKKSMQLKNKFQQSLSTNIDYQSQDIENINPNIFVSVQKEKNQKVTKTPLEFMQHQQKKITNIRTKNPKKYYFKLNQVIEN